MLSVELIYSTNLVYSCILVQEWGKDIHSGIYVLSMVHHNMCHCLYRDCEGRFGYLRVVSLGKVMMSATQKTKQ